ncbi:MAG: Unknown protein [uncultured Sulfurovum sp.]|uniref:Double Cache domain-containing protein n=1 Tax=uncultured Sulfurovum sp. TaxID=269237 RepID=A0A6S6T4X9_9BACT|nr:MAG: Unknown protein [uncultured Sulfurovum sp.]
MKSISKIYFAISFIVLFVLLGSILFFKEETKRDNLQEVRKFVVEDFEEVLAFEKANLLTFALALAEDGALKQALIDDDEDEGYRLLDSIAERFTQNTHLKKLRLQILNNDFHIFAQNWKKTSMGQPISWFRKDLEKLRDIKKPKVGLETGRRLTFKATIPIMYGEKYLGYLEVIKFIDEFAEKLRQRGMEVFALMDEKHIIKDDSLMEKFPRFKGYVIANENYNSKLLAKANKFSWNKLVEVSYYKYEGMLFMLKTMLNGEGKEIGQYLIVLPKNTLLKYQKSRQNISLLTRFSDEDIHNFVKRWEEPSGAYQNVHDRDMIELLPRLFESDKTQLKKLVRTRLEDYTKEELINIILEKTHKTKKSGEIR